MLAFVAQIDCIIPPLFVASWRLVSSWVLEFLHLVTNTIREGFEILPWHHAQVSARVHKPDAHGTLKSFILHLLSVPSA